MKECNSCGKCCIKYSDGALAATRSEIELWEIFRPDIYAYVKGDEIWFDPSSGKQLQRCPFLQLESTHNEAARYSCRIYHDRPEDCRHYPTHINEMLNDECEMIEVTDLNNIKQAQNKLDKMMQDSRPAHG